VQNIIVCQNVSVGSVGSAPPFRSTRSSTSVT